MEREERKGAASPPINLERDRFTCPRFLSISVMASLRDCPRSLGGRGALPNEVVGHFQQSLLLLASPSQRLGQFVSSLSNQRRPEDRTSRFDVQGQEQRRPRGRANPRKGLKSAECMASIDSALRLQHCSRHVSHQLPPTCPQTHTAQTRRPTHIHETEQTTAAAIRPLQIDPWHATSPGQRPPSSSWSSAPPSRPGEESSI